jgi:hypothetical protein
MDVKDLVLSLPSATGIEEDIVAEIFLFDTPPTQGYPQPCPLVTSFQAEE